MGSSVSFRRGDIVQLNSSDRRMMVEEVEDDAGTILRCKWYEEGTRRVDRFFSGALHHYQMSATSSS